MKMAINLIKKILLVIDHYKNNKLDYSISGVIYKVKNRWEQWRHDNGLTSEQLRKDDDTIYNRNEVELPAPERDIDVKLDTDPKRDHLIKIFNFSKYPDPEISSNDKSKTILLVDDVETTKSLHKADFKKIKNKYNLDIDKEFNIVRVYGSICGFIAYKYLLETDVESNMFPSHLILDIKYGVQERDDSGLYLELDGIDLAIKAMSLKKDINLKFLSGHTLNKHNPIISTYIEKFYNIYNKDINEYYIYKNEDRVLAIKDFLFPNKGS